MAGSFGTRIYDFIHGENYPLESKEETARRKKAEKASSAKVPPEAAPTPEPGTIAGAQKSLGGRAEQLRRQEEDALGNLPGRKSGGFTGDLPVDEPAAVAHGQEYVIPADVVSFLGTRYFDRLIEQARQQMGQGTNPITNFDASLDEDGV